MALEVRDRVVEALELDLIGRWPGHELADERLPWPVATVELFGVDSTSSAKLVLTWIAWRRKPMSRHRSASSSLMRRPVNAAGRPPWVHAGPNAFWTWRRSGSRYFTYQGGSRQRSTRSTWPDTESERVSGHGVIAVPSG
jgi:hypothetical protein